jgi:hypothetical protein
MFDCGIMNVQSNKGDLQMIGTLIGGLVIGGIVSSCVKERKAQQEREAVERRNQQARAARALMNIANQCSRPEVVTRTVVKEVSNKKLERQVEFYDGFRELDNKLARNVREGYKGVTYLIKGLEVTRSNDNLKNSLKNIRNYRGRLSHDKRKWKDIPAPDDSLMRDLHRAQSWVSNNYSQAGNLVYKGKKAFTNYNR